MIATVITRSGTIFRDAEATILYDDIGGWVGVQTLRKDNQEITLIPVSNIRSVQYYRDA